MLDNLYSVLLSILVLGLILFGIASLRFSNKSFNRNIDRKSPVIVPLVTQQQNDDQNSNSTIEGCSENVDDRLSKEGIKLIKLNILLLESPSQFKHRLKETLEAEDRSIVQVTSSDHALKLLKTGEFDTAFISVDLPDIDGIDCAEEFRDWQNNLLFNDEIKDKESLKGTLIIGLLHDHMGNKDYYTSEAFDVFVQAPLNKPTSNALIFPAKKYLSKVLKRCTNLDLKHRSKSDNVDLFSCVCAVPSLN